MKSLPARNIIAAVSCKAFWPIALVAACLLPPAYAYDSAKLAAALDSLSAQTCPDWKKRAQAGNPVAQNVLGMAYKYGEVVPQNHASSLHWFHKAALQGDADAQFNLGRIYGKATGSVYGKQRAASRDDVTAAHWYRKAAEQNYAPAQLNLGQMYAEGSPSFPRDLAQAYFWTRQAASVGDSHASIQLANVESEMKATDRHRAQQLAAEWEQRHRQ